VLQEKTPIAPEETAGELTDRLADMGAAQMLNAIELVEHGTAPAIPQEPAHVTISKVFEKEHGRIQWAGPAQRIHNRVRACNPWPMAQCMLKDQFCRILRTIPLGGTANDAPGTIVAVEKNRILVVTGDGILAITQLQLSGRKALDAGAFLRGMPLNPGDRFEDIPDAG
jgi:methionyl-tRNA formyltransferase